MTLLSALQCLDIYQVTVTPNGTMYLRAASCQTVRMREEKDNLEHFAGVVRNRLLSGLLNIFGHVCVCYDSLQ